MPGDFDTFAINIALLSGSKRVHLPEFFKVLKKHLKEIFLNAPKVLRNYTSAKGRQKEYWCYYPYTIRDLVCPVIWIFTKSAHWADSA